jgi:hypothetical protein
MPNGTDDNEPAQEALTPEMADHFRKMSKLGASKGARARANSLTPDERSAIARQAARSRWGNTQDASADDEGDDATAPDPAAPAMPLSLLRGTLKMGDVDMECHVLSDHRRVLTQREVVRVITAGVDSGKLQGYLSRNPLIPEDFLLGKTVQFKVPGTQFLATGYDATLLIEICDKFLEARQLNLLKGTQKKLAAQAEIILRACAKVGIIALIDEATGFQKIRAQNALQLKLQAFIADELQEWARMFPEEFWLELARLEGVRYSPRSRPLRWGKYIMMFVYDAIDSDIGKELRKKNPNPHFKQNHHQWLKKFGREKVNNQLQRVITIMKLCDNMDDFRKKFAKVFQKASPQATFDDLWQ